MIALIAIAIVVLVAIYHFGKKKTFFSTRNIAATGFLTAIEIVLQILGNFITLGPVSINLCLIPIAMGAILYGPFCGAFLGLINGIAVIFAPSTFAIFMPLNPLGTIFICLLKSTLAGLCAGLIYLPFKKKKPFFGSVLASIVLPVVNTGIFSLGALIFFRSFLNNVATSMNFPNIHAALLFGVIGWNFIFELATSIVISPSLSRVIIYKRRHVE